MISVIFADEIVNKITGSMNISIVANKVKFSLQKDVKETIR